MASPNNLNLPERVGGVRVEELLGKGAMGAVFRGLDEALGRPVALKVMHDVADEEALARFSREAVALARLSHPNVVAVYAKGELEGRPFFTMELVEGPTVQAILDGQGAFSVGEAVEITRQAAMGLQAAADAGVIHRDVKPGNLLVQKDGTVKVADFGVCKLLTDQGAMTQEGTALGTPFYMAPEQARGEKVDQRADIYALGATLYHLLAGTPPYGDRPHTAAQLLAHQSAPVPDISGVVQGLPPGVTALIRRMMAKQKEDRFSSYGALLEALDGALEVPPAGAPTVAPSTAWMPPWRARSLLVAAGVLSAATALALWVPVLLRDDGAVTVRTVDIIAAVPAPAPAPTVVEPATPAPNTANVDPAPAAPEPAAQDRMAPLLEAVTSTHGPKRNTAMRLLARSGELRARQALEAVVVNPRDDDAPLAAVLLGEMGDQSSTEALVTALNSPRRATVLAAVDALSALRDVRAVEPLRDLSRRHQDATVRSRAARAGTLLFAVEAEP